MHKTHHIHVMYPPGRGQLVLRTDDDWTRNVEPRSSSHDGTCHEFLITTKRRYLYFKPLLIGQDGERWAAGDNHLSLADTLAPTEIFPHFGADEHCSACELRDITDPASGRRHAYRVFYPPGYHENTLRRYPVLYMQDGQNLFFADEAFQGQHWRVAETLGQLDAMNAIAQVIVVGVYPNAREHEYTQPGYGDYGRFLVRTLKPLIDARYRTRRGPRTTAVMGSSLGGVVSFYLAWEYPSVFGNAACLSSTFGWRDDLYERVRDEPRRAVRLYLDSGWPRDNYEVTRSMRLLLLQRGYREGSDLHYLAFPEALHNEAHWATRAHIPFQFFFGAQPLPAAERPVAARRLALA